MAQQMGNQPLIVLSEESQRTSGKDAQSMNITAGKAVAESVRTTLGPKGMDKMLVDSTGSVVVTNDGVTILDEMDIEHPAANMIVEVAQTQEDEVGDGTTTAVVIAGELLSKAEDLLDQDIHATILAQGYRQAAEEAKEILEDMAIEVDEDDQETGREGDCHRPGDAGSRRGSHDTSPPGRAGDPRRGGRGGKAGIPDILPGRWVRN